MWRPALCSGAIILIALVQLLQPVNSQAQLVIQRNRMDCVYPPIQANGERLWPTSSYLPRGNSLKRITGGLKVIRCLPPPVPVLLLLLSRHSIPPVRSRRPQAPQASP